ncbi:Lcl C-terminal domain-containing protein [Carboxylicivirga marina]|uniref:DUF1566 domain-containing protein n=1 Tax=Carboxylicivirga marina TaxID=2800988 RepID=A0ABS1HDS3_9BACT|nr:DUF1566 domain-containing protein [Carboxylicivirga marina]MBK3515780.1 DUF1566 domain-containing protein [Carboxylicivirga marina]
MKYFFLTISILSFFLFSCDNDSTKDITDDNDDNGYKEVELTINYPIVDTKQNSFYNNTSLMSTTPLADDDFYGQDAQFSGNQPSYTNNPDGTVTDNITGLIWEKSYQRMTHSEALAYLEEQNKGDYNDWRIPTIKELYSLMQFNGTDVSSADMYSQPSSNAIPFIDDTYFDFDYFANGDRAIDVQYYSSTRYTGVTMGKDETVFGLNVADGRIKGYPYTSRGIEKDYSVKLVRGNALYGTNDFADNNDNTITDNATNLMWDKSDSNEAMEWAEALQWAQTMNAQNHLGYNDWRVPNAKELQSILDYSRSPQATNSAAIDPIFNISKITVEGGLEDYPFFWSSTTHLNLKTASSGVYLCFGEALGFFPEGATTPIDVHGAGAQRSDPKYDNGKDYSAGHGPQGDVVRFEHYVRLVRDID